MSGDDLSMILRELPTTTNYNNTNDSHW